MKNLLFVGIGLVVLVAIILFINLNSQGDENPTNFEPEHSNEEIQFSGQKSFSEFPGALAQSELQNKQAVIETPKGEIILELFPDSTLATSNFIFLAKNNFYDGLKFHRRVEGFVVQGGDPKGNGTGGPGYKFPDEVVTRDYERGIVAMANSGPDTNGSQFFIMLETNPTLPKLYTIFGRVVSGMEVVDQIVVGDKMNKVTIK